MAGLRVGRALRRIWSQSSIRYPTETNTQSILQGRATSWIISQSFPAFHTSDTNKLRIGWRRVCITNRDKLQLKPGTIMNRNKHDKVDGAKPDGVTYASDQVVTEKINDITLIAINRPERRNAVNIQTGQQLKQAFISFEEDKNANVAVLYGKGGTFCAGYDLKDLSGNSGVDILGDQSQIPLGPMGPSALELSKPVIGAINGYAVAGGLELSLLCDMRVAEESAVFGVFCRRFGVPLIDGGTVRLPKLIGLSRAMDMILTGRPVKAVEALSFGLVNRVVPDGQALEKAVELAQQIAAFPQRCMRADRLSAYYSTYQSKSFKDAMDFEYKTGTPVILQESVQGALRFAQGQGRKGSFDDPKPKL